MDNKNGKKLIVGKLYRYTGHKQKIFIKKYDGRSTKNDALKLLNTECKSTITGLVSGDILLIIEISSPYYESAPSVWVELKIIRKADIGWVWTDTSLSEEYFCELK